MRRTLLFMFLFVTCVVMNAATATGTWSSKTLGKSISYTSTTSSNPAKDSSGKLMTVVYLENLSVEKVGQNSNETDVKWLLDNGYQVVELNYGGDAKAVSPGLNLDIIAINDALNTGAFCGLSNISTIRAYVLFEGYRINRDVSYYLDDPTVYNYNLSAKDSLYMDIAYPANPKYEVPTIISFAYSNSMAGKPHQRMFLGYTLSMFDDSVLEGAPGRGMAWAICDHPKYCDWGNGKPTGGANKDFGALEINPDAAKKVKSAIRTLRGVGKGLGLGSDVAVFGFSRGSTAACLAIGDTPFAEWNDATRGRFPEEKSDVQAAILGPGVFDYSLMPTTSNEFTRMKKYCGELGSDKWLQQGCMNTITNTAAPCFFFYNASDEAYYANEAKALMDKLKSVNVDYEIITDYSTGHAVPTDVTNLAKIYDFLKAHMSNGNNTDGISAVKGDCDNKCNRGCYTFQGQALSNAPEHGMYIADGKKVLKR